MADVLTGESATTALEEALADTYVSTDAKTKTTVFMPKQAVEAMLSECIVQLKASLDILMLISEDKDTAKRLGGLAEGVRGVHFTFVEELNTVVHCLKDYNEASLNPKHRACRKICI